MSILNKRPAEDVETERARLMARADAAGHRKMVERIQRNASRQERLEVRRLQRAERAKQRKERAVRLHARFEGLRQRLVLLLPLIFVNILALAGQIGFATDHLGWNLPAAIMFGATLESIAVYIGWHAHQALLAGDSAIKLRSSSYLVGAIVGGLNYEHFMDPGGMPTVKSVVFGLMSLISPWLWAMHGRYANRKRLRELGLVDERAPHFAGGRWVHFPIQTWGALRWGIANNVQDPARAWDGYQKARQEGKALKDKRPTVRLTIARIESYSTETRTGLFWVTDLSPLMLAPSPGGPRVPGGPRPMVARGHNAGANTQGGHNRLSQGATTRRAITEGPQGHAPTPPAEGHTTMAPRGGPPASDVAPATDRTNLVELAPRGEVQIKMRSHWDTCIAVGQIPTGADLNRAASKDPKYSLGKKYARVWREDLPAAFVEAVEDGRPDDAAEIARQAATGAGEGVGS